MADPSGGTDEATALYRRANALKDAGQPEAALAAYDQSLALRPDQPYALCNRGVVLAALGRAADALASYDRALALAPRDALTHYNRGALLLGLGQADAALASYEAAAALEPSLFHAHFICGNLQQQRGALDAAIASYGRAVAARPDLAEGWFNRGVLFQKRGELDAAVQDFDRAVALNPALHQAWYNRGNALRERKALNDAVASYDAAIAARADYAEAWCNRGVALQELRRYADALASYERAIALREDYVEAWFNRGTLHKELEQYEPALSCFARAIAIRPDHAQAHCNRGATLVTMRRIDEAIASFERALALDPALAEAHYNRALALLLKGDYAAGWPAHESRWANATRLSLGAPRRFREPLWLGDAELAGKRILVWAEQGLGDTLQFCRYVQRLHDFGAHVILEVQAPLVDVLAGLGGVAQLVRSGAPLPPFDYHCPLMSLGLAFRTTLQDIPGSGGYVHPDPARVAFWRERLGAHSSPRIGLVWSGNPEYGNDVHRSTRLVDWLPHLPRQLRYFCLQRDVRDHDLPVLQENRWIETQAPQLLDFGHTAALMALLDLVISVDTSPGHLSGAMGLRTWTLLSFDADWRWLMDRTDSPWYPATRLYRQQRMGDWGDVLQRIGADLRREFG